MCHLRQTWFLVEGDIINMLALDEHQSKPRPRKVTTQVQVTLYFLGSEGVEARAVTQDTC